MLFELHRVEIANADQLEMALGRGSNQRLKQHTHGVRCPLCQTAQRTALRHKTSPHVPCVFVLLITTEAMVAEVPRKQSQAMPGGGGGMGGMDF